MLMCDRASAMPASISDADQLIPKGTYQIVAADVSGGGISPLSVLPVVRTPLGDFQVSVTLLPWNISCLDSARSADFGVRFWAEVVSFPTYWPALVIIAII